MRTQEPSALSIRTDGKQGAYVDVILFRGSGFCPTCDIMERLTTELFNENFNEDPEKEEVRFSKINLEKQENEKFFELYNLVTTSLILSYRENGVETRWKFLENGWRLAEDDPKAFKQYVLESIHEFKKNGGQLRSMGRAPIVVRSTKKEEKLGGI